MIEKIYEREERKEKTKIQEKRKMIKKKNDGSFVLNLSEMLNFYLLEIFV